MKNNFCLLLLVIILINSCTDSGNSILNNNDDLDDETQILYSTQIEPIFTANCIGCHGPVGGAGGLSLSNYESLMAGSSNNGPIIIPGDAENSIIIQKLSDNPPFGDQMPASGPPLDEYLINLISDWIDEGANNDSAL